MLRLAFLLPLLAALGAQAATKTVCPSGCDYTALDTAYSAMSCGDTMELHWNGDYDVNNLGIQAFQLGKSCTAGTVFTVKAGNGFSPALNDTNTDYTDAVILSGAYHVWDGVTVHNVYHGPGIDISGSHNTVQNTAIDAIDTSSYSTGPGEGGAGIRITGGSNTIQNNTVLDGGHGAVELDGVTGEGGTAVQYNQILNNKITTVWGHCIWMAGGGASYNLIDSNDLSDCGSSCPDGHSGCGSKNGIEISGSSHNSVRRNVFHDIRNRAMEVSSYSTATLTTGNNWIYNNTFYNITTRPSSGSNVYWIVVSQGCTGCVTSNNPFINNIADKVGQQVNTDYFNLNLGLAYYYTAAPDAGSDQSHLASNDWNGNWIKNSIIRLYYSGSYQTSAATAVAYRNVGDSYHTGWTPSGVNGIGSMAGNITSDPLFTSTDTSTTHWWYPQAGSPAIDGGVVVSDPNAATGGWAQLTYNGSAPDIGAYESSGSLPDKLAMFLRVLGFLAVAAIITAGGWYGKIFARVVWNPRYLRAIDPRVRIRPGRAI